MYTPSNEILEKYADIMVNFALRGWKWINPGDVVNVKLPECAKPFYIPLQTAILKAWWHPMIDYLPDGVMRNFYENASDEQLSFLPKEYSIWKIASTTHLLVVIADSDLHELDGIEPSKMMKWRIANKPFREIRDQKEREWKFSRTICMYGTEAMAKEAWIPLEEYRNQIISACFLDEENPVQKRKALQARMEEIKQKLNQMSLEYVHVIWPDEDLKLKIWANRSWNGWSWHNIPSFEIFTSPDCRDVNGWMKCNQPLYRYGNLIEGIKLEFKDGKLIRAHADKNDNILQEMIKIEGMDHLWEFSLTDGSMSKITHFMAETLYDENVWWKFWNTHIALWRGFDDCFNGDKEKLSDPEFKQSIGLNMSAEHVDVISTENRKVVWILPNNSEIVIYENGRFLI